jgi:hypothetical protein
MINFRKEFWKVINKDKEYNFILVRHMADQKCICLTQSPMVYNSEKKANEPNPSFRTVADPDCPNCEGSGYPFEEFIFKCMYFYPGFRYSHFDDHTMAITSTNVLTIYIYPDENWKKVKVNDWCFNLTGNKETGLQLPIRRERKWVINDLYQIRLDSNKVEFLKVYAKPAII